MKEKLYVVDWKVRFQSGIADYKRTGVTKVIVSFDSMQLFFDKDCGYESEHFPLFGELVSLIMIEEPEN